MTIPEGVVDATKIRDLIEALHYNERYPDGTPSLQAIRVKIDTALYTLYRHQLRLSHRVVSAIESVHFAASDTRNWVRTSGRSIQRWSLEHDEAERRAQSCADTDATYVGNRAKKALQDLIDARSSLQACKDAQKPLREAYRDRPWTRAFLVTDGHVHSSMDCSTCYPTTEFSWLVQFTDHDEAEIVEAAGERACTVCYPSAPTLRSFEKASALFTEEEAARNVLREKIKLEKAARDAKRIEKALTPDGSEFVVDLGERVSRTDGVTTHRITEHFKTERSATSWAIDQLAMQKSNYYSSIVTGAHLEAVFSIARAVATKHGRTYEDVIAEFAKKATVKARKEYS